jgi:hypothetical protein
MSISYQQKKQKQNIRLHPNQKLSEQEKELLKRTRKSNRQKRKQRQERKIQKNKSLREVKIKRKTIARDRKVRQKLEKERENLKSFSNKITAWLSHEKIQKIAIYTGYIKRIDLKIFPLPFLLTLAYGFFGNGASTLAVLAANMVTWFNIDITPQALSDRMSKIESVKFLKEILILAMTEQIINGFKNSYANIFGKFESVKIEDSTQFKLHENVKGRFKGSGGSASTSAMKLNTIYNITEHTVSHFDIVPGSTPDQALSKSVKQMKKGELRIRDLGYFNIFDMVSIDRLKAFFISRLKKGVNIFLNKEDKTPISTLDFLEENAKNGNSFDKDVYIGDGESRLKVRIIGEKVPGDVQQKRIHNYKKNKIKRDKNKTMNKEYFIWFSYSVFITNVPREVLPSASIIMTIYKIRWQIELFFKRIKSILHINIIKGETENRVCCLIYAKLISLLMSQSIISYAAFACDGDELSEHKLLQWLQDNNRLGNAIISGNLESLLIELLGSLYLLCKNKRKKRKSTLRDIEKAFMNDFQENDAFENDAFENDAFENDAFENVA